MRILFIDDEAVLVHVMTPRLVSDGILVDSAGLGEDGLELATLHDYDLVLLDLGLPDLDGLEVLRRLRASSVQAPILVLTGRADAETKLAAFAAGADHYALKPLSGAEIVARIRALVRRANGHANAVIALGNLEVDLDGRFARVAGFPIGLTQHEYAALEIMALRAGRPVRRSTFMGRLYPDIDTEPQIENVNVVICKLRARLAEAGCDARILTVRNQGYALCAPESDAAATGVPDRALSGASCSPVLRPAA